MGKKYDLVGQNFGRWIVLEKSDSKKLEKCWWKVRCTCGSEIEKEIPTERLLRGESKSCGCLLKEKMRSQHGENSYAWKGGRYIDDQGYVNIKMRGHANADKQGYVQEHRLVMADHRGYPLESHELVHHKNGVKTDNRIENLEICVIGKQPHPPGQRVSDIKAEYMLFLEKYATKEELQQWIDSIQ